jgi:NAD-dependent deacetylase
MAVLQEATLVEWLKAADSVMAFCGAGVSAESGLPTFRGAGGLWDGDPVEAVATPESFRRDPQRVWRFYSRRQEALARARPNPAHLALAAMEQRYRRFLLVTQNVDDLHERAGSRELVKLHGNLMQVRCVRCGLLTPLAQPIRCADVEMGRLPLCDCGAVVRPNVVWFGEYLNPLHLQRIDRFLKPGLDLLLVTGTSAMVSGGYGLPSLARSLGAKVVEINPEPTLVSEDAHLVLRAPAGELLARVWPQVHRE